MAASKSTTKEEIERESARPLDWFPHDVNSANDMKMMLVMRKFKMTGYGRVWRLFEMLAAETGHRLEVGDRLVAEIVCSQLEFTNVSDMMSFLQFLADIELINMTGDGYISNSRMDRQALKTGANRANGRRGGRPSKSAK